MILFHHTHSRRIQDGSPNINRRGRKEGRAQLSKPPRAVGCSLAGGGGRLDKKTCPCNLTCTCIRSKRFPPAKQPKTNPTTFLSLPNQNMHLHQPSLASPIPPICIPPHTLTVPWPFQLLQKPSILVESAAAMVLACMLGWVRGKTANGFLLTLLPLCCWLCLYCFPLSLSLSLAHRFTPAHE